jgi:hypothetical protein
MEGFIAALVLAGEACELLVYMKAATPVSWEGF